MTNLHTILKDYWGYDNFRYPQEEIIKTTIAGKDSVALLATGAGKSLCFQISGIALGGLTIVISPLIALMEDQVSKLSSLNISAEAIHSGKNLKDLDRILNNAYYGKLQFLYLSPERLESEMVQERLPDLNINLVAIDEAHCVSQWGFDFRPSYLKIGALKQMLPKSTFIALTATASPKVLKDINEYLCLDSATIFKTSFLRDNISLNCINTVEKLPECKRIIKRINGSGIIYVRSRLQTENIAKELSKAGIPTMYYHAGLSNKQRTEIQKKWKSGVYRVVAATNAFGMGIDKANVRFVLHYDIPDKPEEYYQEAGRAGRDGLPATAIMLYNEADISKMEQFLVERFPSMDEIKLLFHRICVQLQVAVGSGIEESFDFDIEYFTTKYGYRLNFVLQGIKTIAQAGWIDLIHDFKKHSTLQILIDNRSLRSVVSRYPELEKLVNAVLRMYEAIFFETVEIRENSISKLTNIEINRVKELLKILHKRKWAYYDEHLVETKVVFLKDRPAANNFTINKKHYNYLKNISVERVVAIKNYLNTDRCRQKELLTYFGELLKKDCGICDVCRGANIIRFDTEEMKIAQDYINKRLLESPMFMKELIYLWPYNKRKRVIDLISTMENEGIVTIKNGIVRWN